MNLSPEEQEALATQIAEKLFEFQLQPVWDTERAMSVVGKKTVESFRNWLRRYAPRAGCGNNRYSREKILQGLRMEEKTGAKHRNGKHLVKPKTKTS